MTPKRIVEKITAFTLSGMIALSSIAVGSITNTNQISAAQTNTKKTEASYDTSWYGKSYDEVANLYGDNVQIYNDNVVDQDDLAEAFSAIRENEKENENSDILNVIYINGQEENKDKLTLTINKPLSIPSNTYILAYGTINFSTGKDSEGNQTQGRFTISGSKNVCIRGNDKTKFVLSSDDTNADTPIPIINIMDGSNNINIVNTSFETKTNCYNSVFVRASDSSGLSFTSLKFKGNVKRAFFCSKIDNTKFTNNTISNLTIPNNESAIYISNITEGSNNTFGNLTINNINLSNNINSSSNNFGYGISIVNSYDTEIKNVNIDGNKKIVGIRISGSNEANTLYSGNTITASKINNCISKGIQIDGTVKNVTVNNTGVANTTAIPNDTNNKNYGIFIAPNYNSSSVLNPTDYIAKIIGCTDTEGKDCAKDSAYCLSHIHNNGIGIYVTASGLGTEYFNNQDRANETRQILVQNNKICCNKIGIQTYSNINPIDETKAKITIGSINNVYNNNTKFQGDGIIDNSETDGDDFSETITPIEGTNYYKGYITGLKYELIGGAYTVVETSTGYITDTTRPFAIPSKVILEGEDANISSNYKTVNAIGDNAFKNCEEALGNGRVIVPNSITKIGKTAFQYCSTLKSIYIGTDTTISEYAFHGCKNLAEIEVAKAKRTSKNSEKIKTVYNANYVTENGVLFEVDTANNAAKLIQYPISNLEPRNITMYFHNTDYLNKMTPDVFNKYITNKEVYLYDNDTKECYFPEIKSFTSIYGGSNLVFKNIPKYATNLSVYIGNIIYNSKDNSSRYSETNGLASTITLNTTFTNSNNSTVIGSFNYSGKDTSKVVASYSIPDVISIETPKEIKTSEGKDEVVLNTRKITVDTLEYRCFARANLTSITLNKSMKEFRYMKDNKDFTVCAGPFDECKNLKTIAVADGNKYFSVANKQGITALYSKGYAVNGVICYDKFYLLPPASGVKDFTLNSNVKSIANYAFAYNPTLESVTYDGTKLYEIGVRAFYGCNKFNNFKWTKSPVYKGTQSNTTYSSLPSFLDYAFTNHMVKNADGSTSYVPNNFIDGNNKNAKFRLGFSKTLLSDNLHFDKNGNLIKSAVQKMYKPLYYGVLENVEEKALAISNNNLNKNFQDFMNGSVTNFFKYSKEEENTGKWQTKQDSNSAKSGTENYDSTDTKKANNVSTLNKSAKWTKKDMTKAEVNIDYSYGENRNKYNFLFVLDKTGSMNEANSASRSKMYDQYSTVYNMSKAILSDKEADNKVGIINFSDETYTDMMNGSDGSSQKITSTETVNKDTDKEYKKYTFGNLADKNGENMLTNNLNNIEKFLANTETEGMTEYDVGVNSIHSVLDTISADTSDTSRKTAVIFISDGAPGKDHSGSKEATTLRNDYPDVPIYTILEFVADSDKASDSCKSAMGEISGVKYPIDDLNNTTKVNAYNTYNKSGKDSNELTNAFKSIYENFTSTPKQVLQDTISQAFTTDSIKLTRTVPQYNTINLAVDVDIPDFNTVYNSLYQTSSITDDDFKLQVNPNVPNLSKHNYSPTKKIITNKHIRYVYSNVYNKTGATYKLISTNGNLNNFLSNTVKGNADGIIKTSSSGLLRIQYNVANGFSLSSSTTLLATNSGVIAKDKDGNYLVTKEEYSIPVPSKNIKNITNYYYLKKNSNGSATVTEIKNVTSNFDFTQYYKDSLDGIVAKVYKDNNEQVHIRVFLNNIQCLVKYSLNFGLTLKSNYQNIYGKSFETNDTDGNTDNECFVVDNNDETLTPTDYFSNYTKISETTKVINKVPTPKLLRQKYGNITVNVMKEVFNGSSYYMRKNSEVKDLTAIILKTEGNNKNTSNLQLIFGNKDSYTYKDQPLYDDNGELYKFNVSQSSKYFRFKEVNDCTLSSNSFINDNGIISATVTLNNYLKKGILEIKKKAFDNEISGIYFNITNGTYYNETVSTDNSGKAVPSEKIDNDGSKTMELPLYEKDSLINYTITEKGIKNGNSYSIPRKYKPEITSVTKNLVEDETVTFDFDNLSRDDFTTEIKNVDKNCYGDTKDNGKEFECVDITNGVPEDKKPVSTNTEGEVYENQIGSFDVTFKNKVADTKSALCEILIDGKSVYSQRLSFNNNGEKTVRVIYDYKWNIDPRKVIARINYNNRNDEVVTNDNVATTTLQPKEWLDFSVKIDGLYTDSKCTNKLPVNKTDGKYYYANKGQQFYIKATFTNKNKGRAYNPPIDVLYGDGFYLEHYFLAEDIPANGSQTGVIEVTADTDLCVKDLAVRINWTGRGSEANPNDNEDKVTVEVRKVLDLSIEPIKPNVSYYNDYDVVTSVMVYNKTTTEAVLPDDHVKVTFRAFVGEQADIGVLCYKEQKEVVIPACKKGEPFASNLVYFKWHVPKEKKTSYIYWIATINEDQKLFEANYSDNTTNISEGRPSLEKKNDDGTPYIITNLDCLVPREDYLTKNTPSTKYEETSEDGYVEKNIGKTFDYITPNDAGLNNYNNQAIWSEWSFDSTNNKFIKHTYGQTIGKFNTSDFTTASLKSTAKLSKNSSHSETIITPDKNSPTVERDDNGNWTMRSGYGFSLKYNPKISSFYAENGIYNSNFDSLTEEEKADKLSNATTGIQMASAYYPEFMYMDKKFTDDNGNTQYTCNTLERNVLSTNLFNFNLPMNDQSASILTNHKEDSRIHFIPIWYKNGDYNISIVASYSWTPAGAISTCDNSTNINIDGSMYDDWYLTGDAH